MSGGVRVQDLVNSGYTNDVRFANPTCNCLGYLGAALGGGLTRTAGLYGWVVDQLQSVNVVLASGDMVNASSTNNPDLWWALLGAAPNFGIATSAVVTTYPIPQAVNTAWQSTLTFTDDKVEDLINILDNMTLAPRMQIDFLFATSGPPDYTPGVQVVAFYVGNCSEAEAAWAPVLQIAETSNSTVLPYTEWNTWGDTFCTKGDRKPAYGISTERLDARTWKTVYQKFKDFIELHGGDAVGNSSILTENYSVQKAEAIGSAASSYALRGTPHHSIVIPWYKNASFDATAEEWAHRISSLLRSTDGSLHYKA